MLKYIKIYILLYFLNSTKEKYFKEDNNLSIVFLNFTISVSASICEVVDV